MRLFCKHDYIKTHNFKTRTIEYKCYKCGKIKYEEDMECGTQTRAGGRKPLTEQSEA